MLVLLGLPKTISFPITTSPNGIFPLYFAPNSAFSGKQIKAMMDTTRAEEDLGARGSRANPWSFARSRPGNPWKVRRLYQPSLLYGNPLSIYFSWDWHCLDLVGLIHSKPHQSSILKMDGTGSCRLVKVPSRQICAEISTIWTSDHVRSGCPAILWSNSGW